MNFLISFGIRSKIPGKNLEKSWPALIVPSPALIVPLLVNRFPNKLAPYVPNNEQRKFCFFASFLIVSLTPFIYKPDSSRDLTIFMISFIYLFEIINVVISDPNIFYG